jgi:hypothetical protein
MSVGFGPQRKKYLFAALYGRTFLMAQRSIHEHQVWNGLPTQCPVASSAWPEALFTGYVPLSLALTAVRHRT